MNKKVQSLIVFAFLAPSSPQAADLSGEPIAINIVEKSLGQALTQLAVLADLNLVYYRDVDDTVRAPDVIGRYSSATVLSLLLKNTHFHAEFVDAHTVVIRADAPNVRR